LENALFCGHEKTELIFILIEIKSIVDLKG